MFHGTRNPCKLKVGCYAACVIKLNEYLAIFTGSKASNKIRETELNKIPLHSMPIGWSRQVYVQGFYFEAVVFKHNINMFEHMEIFENFYEGNEEPS